jgi:glycosyltransferase involved in cell wall biosynthesis
MRILILDQFSEPGGAQLCLRDLSPEIARRGWQAMFVGPGDGGIRGVLAESGMRNERLPWHSYTNGRKTVGDVIRYGLDIPRAMRIARRLARENRAELVYINGPRVLPLGMVFGCPVVFHAHSRIHKRYARLVAATCLRIKRVEVIAASRFAARSLNGMTRAQNIRVTYSGVPDMGFTARPGKRGAARVGIIGRIAPEKGQLDFVRAARLLTQTRGKIEFVVYGAAMFSKPGYEQMVHTEAAGLPIRFSGWARDVASALHDIDILAVPSSEVEAAGRVVMEALSAGTPVVAYPSGGIPELLCDGLSGLLTETPTPESLARSIERLLDNPDLAWRIAQGGRKEWETRFQVERFQREICDFLESVKGEAE